MGASGAQVPRPYHATDPVDRLKFPGFLAGGDQLHMGERAGYVLAGQYKKEFLRAARGGGRPAGTRSGM